MSSPYRPVWLGGGRRAGRQVSGPPQYGRTQRTLAEDLSDAGPREVLSGIAQLVLYVALLAFLATSPWTLRGVL